MALALRSNGGKRTSRCHRARWMTVYPPGGRQYNKMSKYFPTKCDDEGLDPAGRQWARCGGERAAEGEPKANESPYFSFTPTM